MEQKAAVQHSKTSMLSSSLQSKTSEEKLKNRFEETSSHGDVQQCSKLSVDEMPSAVKSVWQKSSIHRDVDKVFEKASPTDAMERKVSVTDAFIFVLFSMRESMVASGRHLHTTWSHVAAVCRSGCY